MAIQINTQNLVPSTTAALSVRLDRPATRSAKPNTNPAFVITGPAPNAPDVYTPPADPAPDLGAMLAMVRQQQTAADYIMGVMDGGDLSGLRDPFAIVAEGEVPELGDPKGAAIDYLIGSSVSGNGDIFNLALSANGQGMETVNFAALAANAAGISDNNLPPNDALAQMVRDVQQSNMSTLLSLGSGGTDRGLSDLI